MCIIVYKPKGIEMPDKDTLKECWNCNSDGAGFAVSDGEKITVHKGYMKFKKLYRALHLIDLKDYDTIIHFRIGTSGLKDRTPTRFRCAIVWRS
jgi:glutamine phosphoribosylpyrophosphate amidotransferase